MLHRLSAEHRHKEELHPFDWCSHGSIFWKIVPGAATDMNRRTVVTASYAPLLLAGSMPERHDRHSLFNFIDGVENQICLLEDHPVDIGSMLAGKRLIERVPARHQFQVSDGL